MGCISLQMGFILMRPALNVKKEKQASISLQRKPSKTIVSSLSVTQTKSYVFQKEDTEFKSSFDEYLEALESIRVDREKKNSQKGSSGHEKKFSKDTPQNRMREQGSKLRRSKEPSSEEVDGPAKGLHRVSGVQGLNVIDQARNCIRSQEVNDVRLKDGLGKNLVVDYTPFTSGEPLCNKSKLLRGLRNANELEVKSNLVHPFELIEDIQDGPRVTQMEMEERIQKLAKCLNDADLNMPEWMFSKTMRSAQIRFSDYSILRVIQILGKLGNWRRVLQVVEWLQMQERFKSHRIRHVYTAALDVLGKTRRPVEALNLFCAMQQHKASYPDIVAYHSIAVTLGQAGHMRELFDVIDCMRSLPDNFNVEDIENWDPRLEPDIVVYNAVLNSCVKRKECEGALWVLQKLAQVGQQPTSTTYGLVMEVMLACNKYDMVHEFFRQVQESSVPNSLTYRVLVNTLWREGKPDEAIEAVQEMESRGFVGSASLYYDLARCLCIVGRCEEALTQVDKICKVASKPLVVTYTGLIQACLSSGNIRDGAFIFNHMQKFCSPNLVTNNIMLKGYLDHGMFDQAKELFQKMIQHGDFNVNVNRRIKPDVHTFNIMLEACNREEIWDGFEYAYKQMLQCGYPFNTKRHLWMVIRASNAGKAGVVETTWSYLMQADRVPPPALVKERFRLKMGNGDLVAALSSVACHPSSHQQSFSKEAWLKLLEDNTHCFKMEALEQLICEVSISISKSESPNFIYQHLLESCVEFVRLHKTLLLGSTH